MPARCANCGTTVMSLRQYFSWSPRRPAKCAHCGAEVTQRYAREVRYGRVVLCTVAVGMIWGLGIPPVDSFAEACGLLLVLGITHEYAIWRVLPWDLGHPGVPGQPSVPRQPRVRALLVVLRVVALGLCLFGGWWCFRRVTDPGVMHANLVETASTMRDVAKVEEDYRKRTGGFTADLHALPDSSWYPNRDVTVRILEASDSLLRAEGRHRWAAPDARCTVTQRPEQYSDVQCERFYNWLGLPRSR